MDYKSGICGLRTTPPAERGEIHGTGDNFGLLGSSNRFREALDLIARLTHVDVPVLVVGETGTGKELVARARHYSGARRDRPFVPVDCGALPETLFESELFGHARGAFTDARSSTAGPVTQADGGTLFFDEIHALSLRSQAALLRFLQDSSYRQLGSTLHQRANVRFVAATNRDLKHGAGQGWFREDLIYRLDVARVRMPSLRERPEDIPELVERCIVRFCTRYSKALCRFDERSLDWMLNQAWPGNVRELENFVQRALLACDGSVMHVDDCTGNVYPAPEASLVMPPFNHARAKAVAAFEASYLRAALAQSQGNVSAAARQAGKERRVFGRLLKKHGIDRSEYL